MSTRLAGIPTLYLYSGSIIAYGAVMLLLNLSDVLERANGLSYYLAAVTAVAMIAIGVYEAFTNNPDEYDIAGPVVGLVALGAVGMATTLLFEFFGVW